LNGEPLEQEIWALVRWSMRFKYWSNAKLFLLMCPIFNVLLSK